MMQKCAKFACADTLRSEVKIQLLCFVTVSVVYMRHSEKRTLVSLHGFQLMHVTSRLFPLFTF